MPTSGYVFFDAESGVTSVIFPPMTSGQVIFLNFPAKTDGAVYSNDMDELVARIGSYHMTHFKSNDSESMSMIDLNKAVVSHCHSRSN